MAQSRRLRNGRRARHNLLFLRHFKTAGFALFVLCRKSQILHRLVQVIRCQVCIPLCHRNARMTKKLADLKQRCPILNEPAREGVTQVVDAKVLDASPFTGTGKRGFHVLDLITETDTGPLPITVHFTGGKSKLRKTAIRYVCLTSVQST